MSNLAVSQNLFSLSPVILNKSDRRRREGAVKNPEVIPATIQHQGVSTRMHGENSLKRHGVKQTLGVPSAPLRAGPSLSAIDFDQEKENSSAPFKMTGGNIV